VLVFFFVFFLFSCWAFFFGFWAGVVNISMLLLLVPSVDEPAAPFPIRLGI